MKQVVYVDILLALNLFVNYFLLLAAGALARVTVKRWRLLLAALLGAAYSLIIFLPPLATVWSVALKLAFSLSIVLAAYERRGLRPFLRLLGSFFAANFLFAGCMLALWLAFEPGGMVYNNGAVYFPVSLPLLAVTTIVCYLVMRGVSYLLRRNAPENHIYQLRVEMDGRRVETKALLDTGNGLSDAFTDTPVIILTYQNAGPLFSDAVRPFFQEEGRTPPDGLMPPWRGRLRLIPYQGVQNGGVLPAFRPDAVEIRSAGHVRRETRVYIAVCREELAGGPYGALLNARLLEREDGNGSKGLTRRRRGLRTGMWNETGGTRCDDPDQNLEEKTFAAAGANSALDGRRRDLLHQRAGHSARPAAESRGGGADAAHRGRGRDGAGTADRT